MIFGYTSGNGIVTTRAYGRQDNLVTAIATPNVAGGGLSFAYQYDKNKNPTLEQTDGVMAPYTWSANALAGTGYDPEDRLVGWRRTGNVLTPGDIQTWNLSLVGDWNATNINGVNQTRKHNAVHELEQINPTTGPTLSYDAKGNLTTDDLGRTYTWDFDNRLDSYNFCWPVRTLRVKDAHHRWQPRTPAMAAGLTDHLWPLNEWLSLPAIHHSM